jgi:UTP--glucose-1-phosphate uridylyltransferase
MKVVIPAAGLATRFLPLSRVLPKELLPLGDKPLIHHALLEAELGGFDSAVVVISKRKSAIRAYFERDPWLERLLAARGEKAAVERLQEAAALAIRMDLKFIDQPEPLGLGDAVLRCRREAGPGPYAVLLPDDVVPAGDHWRQLRALHSATGAATLCVRHVSQEATARFGIAECVADAEGRLRVRTMVEKPHPGSARSNWAIFGRYVVTEAVVEALSAQAASAGELQLTDGFAAVLNDEPGVYAIAFRGEPYDAGTPAEYARSVSRFNVNPK